AVEELAEYFIGKDPLRIEHHWQHVYRSAFFRGGNVLMSALSGIDQALWDIGSLTDEGKARARERLEMLQKRGGYQAFKAGPGGKWRGHEPPSVIDEF